MRYAPKLVIALGLFLIAIGTGELVFHALMRDHISQEYYELTKLMYFLFIVIGGFGTAIGGALQGFQTRLIRLENR